MSEERKQSSDKNDEDKDSNQNPILNVIVSHQKAMEFIDNAMTTLVNDDPIMKNIPVPLTLEEVNSLIALEQGQAMTIHVRREDGELMPIIVEQNAVVLDLKRALRRYVTLKQARANNTTHLSWRCIWKTYWLYFAGHRLDIDHKKLKDYGIRNWDEVVFVKRLKD